MACVAWIRRFIVFHGRRHPTELGGPEVTRFLTSLAVERRNQGRDTPIERCAQRRLFLVSGRADALSGRFIRAQDSEDELARRAEEIQRTDLYTVTLRASPQRRLTPVIIGPSIAETAALVGDPARATMVSSLLDGRALTASAPALAARITPQTASTHLAKLTEAGLLSTSPTVVDMIDGVVAVALLKRPRGC